MNLKTFLYLPLLTILLIGCNKNITSRQSVSVDTNAFYTAFQKDPTDSWSQINFNNEKYRLETLTFTVDDENKPYSVVFVCPAKEEGAATKVYIFYATVLEMKLLNFRCRKSKSEFVVNPVYGKLSGVDIASFSDSTQGELAFLAFSDTVTINALGAYAVEVKSGNRDVVGYKGKHIAVGNNIGVPESFIIRREITNDLTNESINLDLDFNGNSLEFSAPFDFNSLSDVNITGVKEGDIFSSEVRFISTNKTTLVLAKSDQKNYNFIPVPLAPFTGFESGVNKKEEFNINEGHELSAVVNDENGNVDREVIKFFSLSDAQTHTVNIPKSIPTSPSLSLTQDNKFENVNISWDKYEDELSGETQLYRWIFEGLAADKSKNSKSKITPDKLIWYVHVTPGWLKRVSRTPNVYNLTLPVDYATKVVVNNKIVKVWKDEWAFRGGTPVDWELSVYSASENGNAGLVIDYILNRNISENYSFTRVYLRSVISPSS